MVLPRSTLRVVGPKSQRLANSSTIRAPRCWSHLGTGPGITSGAKSSKTATGSAEPEAISLPSVAPEDSGIPDYAGRNCGQPGRAYLRSPHGPRRHAASPYRRDATGLPKLVRHTARQNEGPCVWFGGMFYTSARNDVVVTAFPLFHVAGRLARGQRHPPRRAATLDSRAEYGHVAGGRTYSLGIAASPSVATYWQGPSSATA